LTKRTIKQIKELLDSDDSIKDEHIVQLKKDSRIGVQRLVQQWEKKKAENQKLFDQFEKMKHYEKEVKLKGFQSIAGVDEVGRGPLAGPVVAAAVILPPSFYLPGLTDSKKLSDRKKTLFYNYIITHAEAIGVGVVQASRIDEINIYEATKEAMGKAIKDLRTEPDYLLVDAMHLEMDIEQQAIIKGDAKSISIAAASVVAKVTRDRMMLALSEQYPQYGFEKNMGYGTAEHLKALNEYGVIEEHRKSFSPVKEQLV
jgi:ribonuclease HII